MLICLNHQHIILISEILVKIIIVSTLHLTGLCGGYWSSCSEHCLGNVGFGLCWAGIFVLCSFVLTLRS
jgi:hypothetical protein